MEAVAAFLSANGFEVVDIGDLHVTINAPSKARKKFGTLITKETDALYQLLSGQTEPEPASLRQDVGDTPADIFVSTPGSITSRKSDPLRELHDWLDELKARAREAPQSTVDIEIDIIERIQAKIVEMQNSQEQEK